MNVKETPGKITLFYIRIANIIIDQKGIPFHIEDISTMRVVFKFT